MRGGRWSTAATSLVAGSRVGALLFDGLKEARMTMRQLSRRVFLKTTVAGAAVAGVPLPLRAQPKTFKIGAIHPMTGPLAEPGQACRLGAQLAVEAVNAAGGVKRSEEHTSELQSLAYLVC